MLATGGVGKVFKTTSNAHTLTGDGMGIVFRKGLPLEDMEFFQFHPTGLAGLGILLSEAARGEGAILRNGDGERFMERYAPTIKDLAPRDIVARSMVLEVREGRGAGPNKDYVLLDLTHLPQGAARRRSCPTSPSSPAPTSVSSRYTEPVPVFPTATTRWAASRPTSTAEVLRNNTDVVPGLYAAGRGAPACRCTAPTGWAPTRCWTSTCSAGGPASPPPSTPTATSDFTQLPDEPAAVVDRAGGASCGTRPAPSGSPTSAPTCRSTMDLNAAGVPHRGHRSSRR